MRTKCLHDKGCANKLVADGMYEWANGVMSCDQTVAPNWDKFDEKWDAILNIPLKRVHFCVLHAEMCLIDKLLFLHIVYVWNMKLKDRAASCVSKVEELLSSMGLHGGNVKLQKDAQLLHTSGNLPAKVSMGGVKAQRFLSNHRRNQKNIGWGFWEQLCECTTNLESDSLVRNMRARVWKVLNKLAKILRQHSITNDDVQLLKDAIVEFTQAMVIGWGETHITHYMVRQIKLFTFKSNFLMQ